MTKHYRNMLPSNDPALKSREDVSEGSELHIRKCCLLAVFDAPEILFEFKTFK